MTTSSSYPRVGVGVFVLRECPAKSTSAREINFIIGKRLGSHGSGTWALPGGHLETGESFEECAIREVFEETGLMVIKAKFLTATNNVMSDIGRHYVTIFMTAIIAEGSDKQPQVMEPEKCEEWHWIGYQDFMSWAATHGTADQAWPGELFQPLLSIMQQRPGILPGVSNLGPG